MSKHSLTIAALLAVCLLPAAALAQAPAIQAVGTIQSAEPQQILGYVLEVNLEDSIIEIQPWWSTIQGIGGDPLFVEVTAETGLFNLMGFPVPLDWIEAGAPCYAQVNDPAPDSDLYPAINVWAYTGTGPIQTLEGVVTLITPEEMTMLVQPIAWTTPVLVMAFEFTDIHDSEGNPLEFAEINFMDSVSVEGIYFGELMLALEIEVTPTPPVPSEVNGQIVNIDAAQLRITVQPDQGDPVLVQVVDTTMLFGSWGNPIEFADLALGDNVLCLGNPQPGYLEATFIWVMPW